MDDDLPRRWTTMAPKKRMVPPRQEDRLTDLKQEKEVGQVWQHEGRYEEAMYVLLKHNEAKSMWHTLRLDDGSLRWVYSDWLSYLKRVT